MIVYKQSEYAIDILWYQHTKLVNDALGAKRVANLHVVIIQKNLEECWVKLSKGVI